MTGHLDGRTLEAQLHEAIQALAHARESMELVITKGDGYPIGKFRLCQGRVLVAICRVEELRSRLLLRDMAVGGRVA